VHLGLAGVEGEAEDEAGELGVDEDGAVAVVPVEREQAGGAGPEGIGLLLELRELRMAGAAGVGDEPVEDVADRGLAGLDAVVAGQDRAVDDAADPGDVGQPGGVGGGGDVAGGGADDLDQAAGADAGADRAAVGVEGADGDGDARGQAERLGPVRGEPAGDLDRKSTRLNSSHNPAARMPSSA
jgi:hypothetical protein